MKETKVIDSYNNELHTYIFDQIKKLKEGKGFSLLMFFSNFKRTN